ncbi:hypothetical protein BS636_15560 (plasmid) [Acinetobacter sp. LoGeW2-3]|nr:hypothetical protein BS636_15560 [Acinetobacter sp. LoGeW2-3]
MSHLSLIRLCFLASIAGMMSATAYANVAIYPVKMQINGDNRQRTTTINLHSSADETPKNYEVYVYKWTQDSNGNDILTPDNQLVISPASFVLEPNSKQVIRMGFKQPISAMNLQKEEAWRIKISPLPDTEKSNGIKYAYGFNVPLFAGKNFKADLSFQFAKDLNNQPAIHAKNLGTGHFQITGFTLQDGKGNSIFTSNEMKYILAQQQVQLSIPAIKPQKGLQLIVQTANDKPLKFDIAEQE